jgi:ATP-dependent DNA ligase
MGIEGIVSKRKDSAYRSGRSPDWLKMKNADGTGSEARSRGGLELEHGRTGALSPRLVPQLQ